MNAEMGISSVRTSIGKLDKKVLKNIIASAAPKLAPAETPIRPGSASGFLNKHCIIAPHKARRAPIHKHKSVLGKRISCMIKAVVDCESG